MEKTLNSNSSSNAKKKNFESFMMKTKESKKAMEKKMN